MSSPKARGARRRDSVLDKLSIASALRVIFVGSFIDLSSKSQILCLFIPNNANYSQSENQKNKDIEGFDIMPNGVEVLSYMIK